MNTEGISIIICCYNSEWIIERCLKALAIQKVSKNLNWEIILVNNASTDNTVSLANKTLQNTSLNFSIINENTPGLLSARKCGVRHSKYSYIIFCDDDNLLCENYVNSMYEIMHSDRTIGAFGGRGIAEFESVPDSIIHKHISSYAIGSQKERINDLYGAGLCVRRDCVEKIYNKHDFVLTGRCGGKLLAGDDSELVKSIILQGYKIGASDELTFIHVLPTKRLTKKYLCEMYRGFGFSAPVLYVYDLCLEHKQFKRIYFFYIIIFIKFIIHYIISIFKKDNQVILEYVKYILFGFNFWTLKKLKTIYKNHLNISSYESQTYHNYNSLF